MPFVQMLFLVGEIGETRIWVLMYPRRLTTLYLMQASPQVPFLSTATIPIRALTLACSIDVQSVSLETFALLGSADYGLYSQLHRQRHREPQFSRSTSSFSPPAPHYAFDAHISAVADLDRPRSRLRRGHHVHCDVDLCRQAESFRSTAVRVRMFVIGHVMLTSPIPQGFSD